MSRLFTLSNFEFLGHLAIIKKVTTQPHLKDKRQVKSQTDKKTIVLKAIFMLFEYIVRSFGLSNKTQPTRHFEILKEIRDGML